jgi:hypothetical protein
MIFKTALFCWAAFMAAIWFSANHSPPPASLTTSAEAKPDPARDHRLRAAGLMVIRVSELNNRMIAQCKRAGRLAPPDCEERHRNLTLQTLITGAHTATEGEEQFMKFVDAMQRFERELTPIVQKLEATRLPGDR